jgi:tetratricopeptide (TPR) repeat protein
MIGLAVSYGDAGRHDEAVKLMEEALPLIRKVNGPENPATLVAIDNVANTYYKSGHWEEARNLLEEALPLSRKLNGPEHSDTLWVMHTLVDSCFCAGRSGEAITLLQQFSAANPKDTEASLILATWQVWFGQDADYEATRRQLVQQAEGTDQATTADRAAKVACLRPSTNSALLTQALDLAQRAVKLGQSNTNLPWFQLGLGLAEYRNGQYEPAERALSVAEQTAGGDHNIEGTACLYRAMSLFRQNRTEEARKLFRLAETQMPPLPKEESKPLLDGKSAAQDALIRWLAYKEAKALIESPSVPATAPSAPK